MEENKECYNDKTDTNPETFNKEEDERVSICDDEDDIPNILL